MIAQKSPASVADASFRFGLLLMQGMGFPEIAVEQAVPPFNMMLDQGLLAEPVFAFWLNRNPDDPEGGEMVLGGIDEAHYTGDITWCDG